MNIAGYEEYPPNPRHRAYFFLPTAAYTDSIKDSKETERDYLQGHIKPWTIIYIHESIIPVGWKGEIKGCLIFGVISVLRDLIFITRGESHHSAGKPPFAEASVISDGALPFHFGIYEGFLFSPP